jgi:hypothetical protein
MRCLAYLQWRADNLKSLHGLKTSFSAIPYLGLEVFEATSKDRHEHRGRLRQVLGQIQSVLPAVVIVDATELRSLRKRMRMFIANIHSSLVRQTVYERLEFTRRLNRYGRLISQLIWLWNEVHPADPNPVVGTNGPSEQCEGLAFVISGRFKVLLLRFKIGSQDANHIVALHGALLSRSRHIRSHELAKGDQVISTGIPIDALVAPPTPSMARVMPRTNVFVKVPRFTSLVFETSG